MNNVVQNVVDKLCTIKKDDVVQVGIVVLFIGIFFVCFGLVGNGDFENELMMERDYCENLFNNVHKDYKGIGDTCYARYYGKDEIAANTSSAK